ncbi:unnamed protein product [Spodoptera exigua]|nr:unnamed protein product [Spodoptera exigua]
MECNQRVVCAQELPNTHREQIGYLGICGQKHALFKGHNKLGRDPETCNIILNSNRNLKPYIPYRIKDGDVVQFGDVFGVVSVLGDEDPQPATQDIDIPEIPGTFNQVSNFNKAPTTLGYDKGDSFVPKSTKTKLSSTPIKISETQPTHAERPKTTDFAPHTSSNNSTSLSSVNNPNDIIIINGEDIKESLQQIGKINDQPAANKDIFNAETKPFGIVDHSIKIVDENKSNVTNTSDCSAEENNEQTRHTSKEVLFDEISGECRETETKAVPVEPKILVIPEKTSSFSIHPKRQCKDQCTYCSIKFRLFDKPCHIAQIKNLERQKKVLDNEKALTVDSCLCERCYRYVIRRNSSYRKRPISKHPTTLARK